MHFARLGYFLSCTKQQTTQIIFLRSALLGYKYIMIMMITL